jgi:hypothetical protein
MTIRENGFRGLGDRGFTPRQREQLAEIVRTELAGATPAGCPRPADPRRIEFSGSLDSRQLVGNIADGIVHYTLGQLTAAPAAIAGRLARWVGIR